MIKILEKSDNDSFFLFSGKFVKIALMNFSVLLELFNKRPSNEAFVLIVLMFKLIFFINEVEFSKVVLHEVSL